MIMLCHRIVNSTASLVASSSNNGLGLVRCSLVPSLNGRGRLLRFLSTGGPSSTTDSSVPPPTKTRSSNNNKVRPEFIGVRVRKQLFLRKPLTAMTAVLDEASHRLYENCAWDYSVSQYCNYFGIADSFVNWFKLTILHMWLINYRAQRQLDADEDSLQRLSDTMTMSLWKDVERIKKDIKSEVRGVSQLSVNEIRILLQYMLIDLECSALGEDDTQLAGTVWRQFADMHVTSDTARNVNRMVEYIRLQIYELDQLEFDNVAANGYKFTLDKMTDRQKKKTNPYNKRGVNR